jgi:predicted transcriptional regulator
MPEYKLGEIETRFAELIWANAPVPSGELVKLAEKELGWKKSTTYTVLRRLCEKGIFVNANGAVAPLVQKAELYAAQSEEFVQENFAGSLPAFLTAFTSRKKLTEEEIAAIVRIIEENRG